MINMAQQTKRKSQGSSSRRSSARGSSASRGKASANGLGKAKDATLKGANAAGDAVGSAAKKLKTPAIAAGAGLAGVAGGIALARSGNKKKVLGVSLPNRSTARSASKNLGGVAKNVGAVAERTGRVAEQVRVASEAISESNSRSKSPVEVVLEGLTTRSHSRAG